MFEALNNGKRTVKANIDTKAQEFKPLKDFIGHTIEVDGYFFTQSRYGKQVVVVGNGYNINMPKRAVKTFEVIDSDPEMVAAILNNGLIITDIELFKSDNGNDTVTYRLQDHV